MLKRRSFRFILSIAVLGTPLLGCGQSAVNQPAPGSGGASKAGGESGGTAITSGGATTTASTGGAGAGGDTRTGATPATGGALASGGTSPSGGSSGGTVARTGGMAGVTIQSGGQAASGGASGADAGTDAFAVVPSGATTAVSNGLRGEEFNTGWKFNRGDIAGAEAASFGDSAWKTLDVPHDWSIELPFNSGSPGGSNGGYLDGGIGWYRKSFTLDQAAAGKRILIQFDGVYMNSQVWCNGTSLGTRPYGYTSFEYDLTACVKFDGATNVIAVKVNNNQPIAVGIRAAVFTATYAC